MFFLYDPGKNSINALSSVSMDIICMLILFIIISSFAFHNYAQNQTTRLFEALLVATIGAMFLDFLNWAFDGLLEFWHLTYWFTLGSFCMGSVLACIFILYLYSYMEETHGMAQMRMSFRVCAILNLVSFGMSFIFGITGTAFEFVDGHYETGVLYDLVTVIPILSLIFLTGYVIRHVKRIGVHDVFAAIGYCIILVAGALVEAVYTIGTTYVGIAIADIFIFVTLQNEIIAQEKRKVEKWMKRSNTDELTGFANRHAYEADLKELEAGTIDDDFVYVSVDVNGLKATNDSFGHVAGDELLMGAASCLKKCFAAYGKLYRIGGDEFVALIYVDKDRLEKLQKEIEERTQKWAGEMVHDLTISCGYVTRAEDKERSVREMAILADHRMYEAKNEYYRRAGIDRRKR